MPTLLHRAVTRVLNEKLASRDVAISDTPRKLSPEEEAELDREERKFLPKIFRSHADKPGALLSSPWKGALIAPLLTGAYGAGLGGVATRTGAGAATGAGIGALAGLPVAALMALALNARNKGIRHIASRLSPNASLLDYERALNVRRGMY